MDILEKFKQKLKEIVELLKTELSGVRTNRPSAGLLEDIKVEYYGQTLPIKQLGTVGITPPREIHVQVWDKSAVQHIAKAIESSSLGLSTTAEGSIVRVFLPELSEERREEFIKHVKKISEEFRIEVRHERDEVNKEIEKMESKKEIGEDEKFRLKEKIQSAVEDANKQIEELLERKIKEIKE